jgi:hypothetical protein
MNTSKQFISTAKFLESQKSHIYQPIVCFSLEAITKYER